MNSSSCAFTSSTALPIYSQTQSLNTTTFRGQNISQRFYSLPTTCQTRQQPRMNFFDFWSKKPEDPSSPPKFNFSIGYSYLAHPEKNTGEDAFFVEGNAIGVFDGVSGASDTRGVDPRLYSQTLAAITRDLVRDYGPSDVVKAAFAAAESNDQIGASTACVIGMDRYARLFGINLGDSGVRIIRNGKLIFRTKEQQHFFNCPYQLGTDSEDGLAMGQNVQQKLKPDDWVIIATDGLYDNVSNDDIVEITNKSDDPMQLADQLGDLASARSVDKEFQSPFMLAAMNSGVEWKGGKADDITIVTARVVDNPELKPESLLSTLPEVAEVE